MGNSFCGFIFDWSLHFTFFFSHRMITLENTNINSIVFCYLPYLAPEKHSSIEPTCNQVPHKLGRLY